MPSRFHFGWPDILIAPTRSLSLRYITILAVALAVTLRITNLGGRLAAAASDLSWDAVADSSGWFPIALGRLSLTGIGIAALSWWLASLVMMTAMIAVSVAELEKLKGNPFARIDQVFGAAWKRIRVVVIHDLLIAALLLVLAGIGCLTGLLALAPHSTVAPVLYGLFLIPGSIVAVLVLFIIIVWLLGRLAIPAIAAAELQPTSFVLTVELFSTVLRQPYRWFGTLGYALLAGRGVSLIYALVLFLAMNMMVLLGSAVAGDGLIRLIQTALARLPLGSPAFGFLIAGWPGMSLFSLESFARDWGGAGTITFLSNVLLLLGLSVTAYWLGTTTVALLRCQVIIRRIKDNRDLTSEASYFGREESLNPAPGDMPSLPNGERDPADG